MNLCLYHHFRYFLQLIDIKVIFAGFYGLSEIFPWPLRNIVQLPILAKPDGFHGRRKAFQAISPRWNFCGQPNLRLPWPVLPYGYGLLCAVMATRFPFVFNDEFGALSGTLPWAALLPPAAMFH